MAKAATPTKRQSPQRALGKRRHFHPIGRILSPQEEIDQTYQEFQFRRATSRAQFLVARMEVDERELIFKLEEAQRQGRTGQGERLELLRLLNGYLKEMRGLATLLESSNAKTTSK